MFATKEVRRLCEGLREKNVQVRCRSAQDLGEIGPGAEYAVPMLIKGLKDQACEVCLMCAWALIKIGPAANDAVPAFIKALTNENPLTRGAFVVALAGFGRLAAEALPKLRELKDSDPDQNVRELAALAASAIGKIEASGQ
jgi:HEAT repeat protein